jgi:hypothetical protein
MRGFEFSYLLSQKELPTQSKHFSTNPNAVPVLVFPPLSLNRTGQMDDDLKHELDQYQQAELLMRMVKAQMLARQGR